MTNGCNLCCDYCFERERMDENRTIQFLKEEDIFGYMNLILRNRKERRTPQDVPSWINFFGGEPMLCWDLILKVMREFYPKYPFFHYSIITNGLIVDEKKLEAAKGLPILWQFSLDSAIPEGNRFRFKDKTEEYTKHVLQCIELTQDYKFETPIVSTVVTDQSVNHLVETYHYFAKKRIPIKWQIILERIGDQSHLIDEYNRQNLELVELLAKDDFNIPMLWQNVMGYYRAHKNGEQVPFAPALSEAASPNNIYIVAPNGKIYLSTNFVNAVDTKPEFSSIGELPNGVDIDKVKNHPYLKMLDTKIDDCYNCPSFAVNPCCIEKKFFVYPSAYKGNCNSFLSSAYYALELLKRKGEL